MLAIWYGKAVDMNDIDANYLAKCAIRSKMHNQDICLGKIRPDDAFDEKIFRFVIDDETDRDIVEYLETLTANKRKYASIIRSMILSTLQTTSEESWIPSYMDVCLIMKDGTSPYMPRIQTFSNQPKNSNPDNIKVRPETKLEATEVKEIPERTEEKTPKGLGGMGIKSF